MADDNRLTGLNLTSGGIPYPVAQPMQMGNPLAQIQQLQGLDLQNQQLQTGQAALGENRIRFVQDRLGSLMNKPDLKIEDAQNMVGDMVRNKVIPPQEAPAILQHLPDDPVALRAALKQSYASTLDFANRRSLYFGDQTAVNTGGATQFGAVPYGQPGRPQFAGGTSLPNTLSPGEKIASQPAIIGGVPYNIPNVSRFGPTGNVLPTPAVPQPGAGAAANMAPRGMAAAVPAGAMQAAQAPGVEASASTAASTDANRATAFEEAASRVNDSKAILDRMDTNAATFTGGPASPLLKKAGGYINQAAGALGVPTPITSQAAREAFDKDAALLAGQQSSVLGNTDAAKSLASVMTPGSSNTNEGIRNIAAVLKGNQDAIAAKGQAWNAYKNALPAGTARFSDFENQFNTHFSPRAFAMVYMSSAERQKMWNNMSTTERAQVQRSYEEAKAKGYLTPPGSSAPSPPNAQ